MVYKAKVAVCSEIHTKHSMHGEHHVEFFNIKPWWYGKKPLGFKRLNCWTSSSDFSGYHADFHEGYGVGTAWYESDTLIADCAGCEKELRLEKQFSQRDTSLSQFTTLH